MPYKLQKSGKGYYVVNTETGEKMSKKPLSKLKAEAQLKALYINVVGKEKKQGLRVSQAVRMQQQQEELAKLSADPEQYQKIQRRHQFINQFLDNSDLMDQLKQQDPLSYLKIMKMKDGDFEGGGFIDTLKKSKLAQALTKRAKQVSQFVSNLPQRIQGTITGRDNYPPEVREIIEKYGSLQIKKICLYREPLEQKVNTLTNVLSLGQMSSLKKKYAFDDLYHLYMVVTLQQSQDNFPSILVEKNEVIHMKENPQINPNAQKMELYLSPKFNYTFQQFLQNGEQSMGPRYFTYDPFNNNCQVFIMSLLSANPPLEQDNPNARKFILQDVQGVERDLNPITKDLFRGATNLASRLNVLVKGYGFI